MNIVLAESTEIKEINRLIESAKRYWGYSDKLMDIWLPDLLIIPEDLTSRTFWLAPSAMGKGLGRKMFQFIINHLKSVEAIKLVIVTDPNAEGFYQKMGQLELS